MVKISCTKGSYKLCVVQMDIWFNLIHDSVSRLYVKDSHYFCLSGNIQTSTAWLGPLLQLQSRCWPLHCIWKGSSFQAPFSCWQHSFPCQLPAGGALSLLAVALVSGHLASSIFKSTTACGLLLLLWISLTYSAASQRNLSTFKGSWD